MLRSWKNGLLLVAAIGIMFLPLVLRGDAEFSGTDVQALDLVKSLSPGYRPWAEVIWSPPSAEVESFFWAIQAALGSGFIGYYLGFRRGARKKEEVDR